MFEYTILTEEVNEMEVQVFLRGTKEPVIYTGDRIDILDLELNGVKYKQIRYFRKGFSKSHLVEESEVSKILTVKERIK